MNAKITIGEMSLEITDATTAELLQFVKEGNQQIGKTRDVVSVTREAITAPKQVKRPMSYIPWAPADLLFLAKMAVDLGPEAKVPASVMAKAMKNRAGNKRSTATLYAMSYNIARFLKMGRAGNLSKTNIAELEAAGYTAGMMTAASTNLLGDPRSILVQQA